MMSTWKLRSPDSFNLHFQAALITAKVMIESHPDTTCQVLIMGNLTESGYRMQADKFRQLRANLRRHPMHRFHRLEMDNVIRTKQTTAITGRFDLSLTIRRKQSTDALSEALAKART